MCPSCPLLSDFIVFDHRNTPVQRHERVSDGNKKVARLTDCFASFLILDEKERAIKECQELKSIMKSQRAWKHGVYASLLTVNTNDLNANLVLVKLMITIIKKLDCIHKNSYLSHQFASSKHSHLENFANGLKGYLLPWAATGAQRERKKWNKNNITMPMAYSTSTTKACLEHDSNIESKIKILEKAIMYMKT